MDFLGEESTEKDIFKEEPTEETPVEEEKEEKPLPFHKDPKVQRYVEKQIEKALKDVKPSAEREFKQDVQDIKYPALVKLIGNDTPEKVQALKELQDTFQSLKGEAKQEFLDELKQREDQAKQADNAAIEELESGFEKIEEEHGVDLNADTKTRAAFVEYLRKISHKDANGEVDQFADIPSTWETFQERAKSPGASRAKQLAARGLTRSADTSTLPKGPISSAGDPWRQVDRYIDSLGNSRN